jgi:hypothetical protein
MQMQRRSHKGVRTVVLLLTGLIFAGAAVAERQAQVTVEKGRCRLIRNGSELNLKEGITWRWLEVGDSLAMAEESRAVVKLDGCGEIVLGPEASVQVVQMDLPGKKGTGEAEVHLQQGAISAVVGSPKKPTGKGRCELGIRMGQSVVRGSRYRTEMAFLEDGRYHVSVPAGRARIEHDSGLLALLGSGVTIDDGPPVTIIADPDNEFPIALSQAGSVVYALAPGQSLSVERTDGGYRLTNLGEGTPVHAIEWDGAPAVQIQPGEQRLFPITETDIDADRIYNHTILLARVLSETYPKRLAGLGRKRPGEKGRVMSRQDAFDQVLRYPVRRRGSEEVSPSR